MQMCKRIYQVSNQVNRNRHCLIGLNELYFTSMSAYHCTSPLLMSRDIERLRKNPLNSNKVAKSYVSRYKPTLRDDTSIPKIPKTQSRQSQVAPTEKRSVRERKVASELQKLRFEDFAESETGKIFGIHKDSKGEQLEIVFGVAPCLLALMQDRRRPSRLFVKDDKGPQRDAILRVCQEGIKRGVQIQRVDKKTLDKMCGGKVHQGLCLLGRSLGFVTEERPITSHHDHEKNQEALWLVLDRIQDPMNLGAILRSAYFLGVDRVVSSIHNSCPLTPTVSKASAGVMEVMKVFGYSNLKDLIKVKAEQGWQVVGTVGLEEGKSEAPVVPCSHFKMSRPTLLLMGGEGEGLSSELRQLCDVLLTISPRRDLQPGVESLNVSVATGILLHSLLSTRTLR
ncbi:rRNA methyltransferase 1, mitochondrial [Triplophysa rosa]|uniref:rRNA methyltransferase 1, mitochondrial n=1 Tax=Triplophysa rosa TaxID=992332 RepID=A0A9W7X3E7_TRIRA|nr:rRNA methyltransferase 1, mitochondrial [Triplophysa rosa]KAI7812881.1 putative rRNA methyltransferase 1 [Triplophysa rosa]